MTITRAISRSIFNLKPPCINFQAVVLNQIHRKVSMLVVNPCQNDKHLLKDYQTLKICHSGQFMRYKFKKSKQQDDEEDDDFKSEIETDDVGQDKHSKIIKVTVNSLRLDLIIKNGLGIARNKVEALFYESKIRVNGQKIDKKSAHVDAGDEIDVIKGVSQMNPDHLVIQRVEIIGVKPKEDQDGLVVHLRRNKSLIIENYEDPYKGGSEND